jgi:hypothetical protein
MLTVLAVTGCAVRDAVLGDRAVVARAAAGRLTVGELAEMMAAREISPRERLAEQWAWWWVEYTLFAQRLAAGDSLLDSATVLETRWPDVRQAVVDGLYQQITSEQLEIDANVIDSAYAVGDLRVIDHILIRAPQDGDSREARNRATALRSRVLAGGSWSRANAENEDTAARQAGGRLGVITRGDMAPEFEDAAYALEPGGIAPVTRTSFGYHVIRRPRLEEVFEQFAAFVRDTLYLEIWSRYSRSLLDKWDVEIREDAPALLRDVSPTPNQAKAWTDKVLATHSDGSFTVPDFVRWLQVLPPDVHEQIPQGADGELRQIIRDMLRYELEWKEAQAAGYALPDSVFRRMRQLLARDIARAREVLAVDSVHREIGDGSGDPVAQAVLRYVGRVAGGEHDVSVARVPPFLSEKLRSEEKWQIRYNLLSRVVERAAELQFARRAADAAGPSP